ncbi:MAG: hypothetical protein ACREOI_27500, partial [bacterium]
MTSETHVATRFIVIIVQSVEDGQAARWWQNYSASALLARAKVSVILSRASLRQAIMAQSFCTPLRKNFAEAR